MFRVAAGVISAAALSAGVAVGATPVIEIGDTAPAVEFTVAPAVPDVNVGDTLPAPIANQTTTVIPLPPGVVFGLVGLASAAIARRRYLKRH
jgi:hypothetical protein